ncbi:hypothetical protein RhiirA4_551151 [Rhizophagus irregularis]|uniref:Uncharacterized protein n=1 Tax=Rhizophagus irregularis TaxID=588596 RepID=A0A2I1HTK6_9GLOM|nr:hypothetical protein RhiirA4_551151 [Rhizophagus irregularis]
MMDRMFEMVPVIFCQLYTIHVSVSGDNSRVLPFVYSLITGSYVHENIRHHLRNGSTICSDPLFPPQLWSVYDSIETGVPRA